ncbi:Nickel transporter NicT [Williamsia deligens]|uniref:Nickel/cobalt efflux system n=1 Tax=Williamsia deligens TaxID=321325 RepID=A0ABW3G6N7_9NOCA|nr:HoxN/HupN/NixA family nickel/cobalt transporter [Williamsia deligens]
MAGAVVALHVIGFAALIAVASGDHRMAGGAVFGIGLGVTAYTLGMRHAFDADHIAAIDNTTRKLVVDGRRPLTVGFWFSLGHSTVVFGLCLLLAAGVRALASQIDDDSSTLQTVTGVFGTSVSGLFLIAIGVLNLVVLLRIRQIVRDMRDGRFDEAELDARLSERGVMTRVVGRFLGVVRAPWHMYPVGLLFGLGFDTATEVSLLVLAGTAAVSLPWYAILTLPVLFTAGMSLFDSLDGAVMHYAYGWAHQRPARRLFYNVTVTALSVAVALLIGGIELIGLLADKLGITSGPLAWIGAIDLEYAGYVVVALFVASWALALAIWRIGDIERRWSPEGR